MSERVNDVNQALKTASTLITDKHTLPLEMQKPILQMCWAQHDAQWFLKSKNEVGVDEANLLNRKVIYSMGKIEARHILNALNLAKGEVKSVQEIFKVMNTIMDVYFPNIMQFKFLANSSKEGTAVVESCFIWDMVRQSGGEGEYICACNSRHQGWLDATLDNGKIEVLKRISNGDDMCIFRFIMEESDA